MTAKEIIQYMESLHDEEQRRVLMGFFKTAPGEYGYGDEFLGIKVPLTREVMRMAAKDTPLSEVPELLRCRWHEVRLCGPSPRRPTPGPSRKGRGVYRLAMNDGAVILGKGDCLKWT